MLITGIEYQKKNPDRVSLFVNGSFVSGISVNILAKYNLYESKEITQDEIENLFLEDISERFLNRAIEYIVRSPKSEYSVLKYLRQLKFKKQGDWFDKDIHLDWEVLFKNILDKLKEYKYIDDMAFAKLFVNSRIANRPRGKMVLIGELISKGIDKQTATDVCNELIEDEYSLLDKTFKKRFKEQKLDLKNSKMVSFLMRKGFNWDLIEKYSRDELT